MGASVSTISSSILSRRVLKEDLESVIFDQFPAVQNLFDGKNTVRVEDLLKYFENKTDVFLSHDWGDKKKNHNRVLEINELLKERNLITWCDEEKIQGDVEE